MTEETCWFFKDGNCLYFGIARPCKFHNLIPKNRCYFFKPIPSKEENPFDRQVGGTYYKNFKYDGERFDFYKFFYENAVPHAKAAVVRRIMRYDQENGQGLKDLDKIIHECQLLKWLLKEGKNGC